VGAPASGVGALASTEAAAPDRSSDGSAASVDAAIVVEGVTKRFKQTVAVDDCHLVVERGAFVSLLGPSGCGKTTLLRMIGGFESQDGGRILIHGKPVDRLPPNRRPVNMVFQRYALFPHKSVYENIAFPLELRGVSKKERRKRVQESLELVRLPGVEHRRPTELSGGQAQRIALARALVGRPDVLLLDEPLTSLDLKLRKAMQLELRSIQEELGTTFLYVTHDQEEALTMSDRIVLMNEGRIVQEGEPAEIYNRPESVFASHFIGETNLFEGEVVAVESTGTRVRVGSLDVAAPTGDVRPGVTAAVSVRPQAVAIGPSVVHDHENRFRGRLERRIFLGNLVRWYVEIDPGVIVTAEGPAEDPPLEEGTDLEVSWRRNDSILLPQPS
jgi:spermidine/putrescine transport system ATP-binding protein